MVVKHDVAPSPTTLSINWVDKLSHSWCRELSDVCRTKYMSNLMFYLKELYKCNPHIYPKNQNDIFRPFVETPWASLKVVIFGNEPVPYIYSNGFAFGSYPKENGAYAPEITRIANSVKENFYYGHTTLFDYTLGSWAEQGVLLLNTSLVSERGFVMGQAVMFREFIREVVKTIDTQKHDIIFVFTDERQHYFKQFIDQSYNHIIEVDGIANDPELFNNINKRLIETDGMGADIKW